MLSQCLRSIPNDVAGGTVEVIVVDNGSVDGSVDVITPLHPRVVLLRNDSNLGYAPACNQGADSARGAFLLFLNNDAVLEHGALEALVAAAAREPSVGVLQPVILSGDGIGLDSAGSFFTNTGFLWHAESIPSQADPPVQMFAAKGAVMLVCRDVFEEVKGFDANFFAYFEDSDLCWRARMAGWGVALVPAARARHLGGATTTRFFHAHEIDYLSFRNRMVAILTNSSPRTLFRLIGAHLAASCATATVFACKGKVRSAIAILRGVTWPFRHPVATWKRRASRQQGRRVTDKQVFERSVMVTMTLRRALGLLKMYLPRWTLPQA